MQITLLAKLLIFLAVLGLIGVEQYWVFNQGRKVEMADSLERQTKALTEALNRNDLEARKLRAQELKEAADLQKKLEDQNLHLAKDLQAAKEALRKAPKDVQTAANTVIPPNIISLLNGTNGS